MAKKLWGGRFKKAGDPQFERFSASLKWDRRLLPYDLKIDLAHVSALRRCGVLSAVETSKLLRALRQMQTADRSGKLRLSENAEDVHSAVQDELKRRVGGLADKLHTGRSRNDLVAQSSRLYVKEHSARIATRIRALQKALVLKAEEYVDTLIPGMTHLQNAQVVSVGHILLAYVEMIERARLRFLQGTFFSDVCVLGSGALAGVTFDLDQKRMAKELGLSRVTANSYDVSGDRDYLLHILSCCAFHGAQLSRMAEDLMIWQTRGSRLVDIDETLCTGSSMMPQKKNADFVELARGASGVFIGNMVGFITTLKGLPTSYNRDLQWDKRSLFESVELCEEVLEIFEKLYRTLKFHRSRAKELMRDDSLYATDLADHLVRKGVSFRDAHEQVGRIVSFAEECGKPISKIGLDLLKKFAPSLNGEVYAIFDPERSVRLKRTVGSTHPRRVAAEILSWKKRLRQA